MGLKGIRVVPSPTDGFLSEVDKGPHEDYTGSRPSQDIFEYPSQLSDQTGAGELSTGQDYA